MWHDKAEDNGGAPGVSLADSATGSTRTPSTPAVNRTSTRIECALERCPMGYDRAASKRAVNMTLNEDLVRRARGLTPDLSETVENLLAAYVEDYKRQPRSGSSRSQPISRPAMRLSRNTAAWRMSSAPSDARSIGRSSQPRPEPACGAVRRGRPIQSVQGVGSACRGPVCGRGFLPRQTA